MWTSVIGGNLGSDAELKYLQSGDAVCNFSVAHSDKGKDGKEKTVWIRVAIFGKRAEILSPMLTKGKTVTVLGTMSIREYEAQGKDRYSVEMKMDHLFFGSSKGDSGGQPVERGGGYQRPGPGRAPARGDADESGIPAAFGPGDEDIPY